MTIDIVLYRKVSTLNEDDSNVYLWTFTIDVRTETTCLCVEQTVKLIGTRKVFSEMKRCRKVIHKRQNRGETK